MFCSSILYCQDRFKIESLKSNFAKSENKEKYYRNLVKNVQSVFIEKEIKSREWISVLRDIQSINLSDSSILIGIGRALELEIDSLRNLQRVAIEVSYSVFPNVFEDQILKIAKQTTDIRSFVLAAHYLNNYDEKKYSSEYFINLSLEKFSRKSPLLDEFKKYFTKKSKSLPNIIDLIKHPFQEGKTIIYSFQRKDRTFPGITIIKKPNGEFVRNNDKSLFFVPQLALSFSNLPSYIPNGNTPQGIYSIVGWYISPTATIGPTPNVLVRSPFEVTPDIFFHKPKKSEKWSYELYQELLPKSWQSYEPIYNSYYSGKIGRRLIIIHGSTDEQSYFKDKPFYPIVPTRGCLSSKEIWDPKSGKCIESDQLSLINKFINTRQTKGFLVIIEIDDSEKPVLIDEIEKLIN